MNVPVSTPMNVPVIIMVLIGMWLVLLLLNVMKG